MAADFQTLISSPTAAFSEGLRFFDGTGMLNDALSRLANDLERHEIDYVVVGAVALNQHGFQRFTADIDLLVTKPGLDRFIEKLVGLGYRPAFEGAKKRFRTTAENVPIDIITTGEFPGDGQPKPVVFPEPSEFAVSIGGIRTITLEKLVELKLASGISASDRVKDLGDVQELIKIKQLDQAFGSQLDASVRGKYMELYQGVVSARNETAEGD